MSWVKEKFELEHLNTISKPTEVTAQTLIPDDFIFVKSEYENIKINTIKYIQGLKYSMKIYTK